MIVINKPTRITKSNVTLTDTDGSTGIKKIDISGHFQIIFITSAHFFNNIQNKTTTRERKINEKYKQ